MRDSNETVKRTREDDTHLVRPAGGDSAFSRNKRSRVSTPPNPTSTHRRAHRGSSNTSDDSFEAADVSEDEERDEVGKDDEWGERYNDGNCDDDNFDPALDPNPGPPCTLKLEYWMRSVECTERKLKHIECIDREGGYWGMEDHIEKTVFRRGLNDESDVVLEKNLFPYECPPGISHHTLWSRDPITQRELVRWCKHTFLTNCAYKNVKRWNFDMNGNHSVDVPHYHIFVFEERSDENADKTNRERNKRERPATPPGHVDRWQ